MRKDYVDSCVFLGFVLEKDQKCKDYINTIGYKNRNIGIISHFVVSEIFISIIIKIKYEDKIKENFIKNEAFQYIDNIFNGLAMKRELQINKLSKEIIDINTYDELKNMDYKLTDDDIFHLIEAIKSECHTFVTIDNEILNNTKLKNLLLNRYGIKIIEPKIT